MGNSTSIIVYAKKGCSYCEEVKQYLTEKNEPFEVVDITGFDQYRDVLQLKYGVRHVPVIEIGSNNTYKAVTKVGIEHLVQVLSELKEERQQNGKIVR